MAKTATEINIGEKDDFDFGGTEKTENQNPKAEDKNKDSTDDDTDVLLDDNSKDQEQKDTSILEDNESDKKPEKKQEKKEKEKVSEVSASKDPEETVETLDAESDDDDLFVDKKAVVAEKPKSDFSFKALAKRFDIDLESDAQEEFESRLEDKIEKSKADIAVDKFSPDAQKLIRHLHENDGKLEDFFNNKTINSLQGVIGLDPATKVASIRAQELQRTGLSLQEAQEQADSEIADMTKRELKEAAENINADATDLISKEIEKITGDRQKIADKKNRELQVNVTQELRQLKTLVEKQENYMGIKLTQEAKKLILSDIDSGEFDNIANKNKASSKFNAYMIAKFGDKISGKINKTIQEKSREAHNAAIDKSTSALHKSVSEAQRSGTGRQKSESGEKKNFDSWSSDLFDY